ncbi:tetratricopeptide repeat protein [Bradyrhizobium sp.]|uniref:tetratricopeptide repeat protein n=1 Tax=Bradyrhizobium sp. TaxID=376 RepID=UPI003C3F58E5
MLAAAVAQHRAGRLAEAERLCRSVCEMDPSNARAFHLAGVIAHQLRRPDAAALIGRAVTLDPAGAEAHNDRGVILAASGALSEALSCFERAVQLKPDYSEARNNLGRALRSAGRADEALTQFAAVLAAAPNSPLAHFNLASVLDMLARQSDAEQHYRRAIGLRPDFLDAHIHLAMLLQKMDRLPEALVFAERAVTIAPNAPGPRNNLGNVLRAMERRDAAMAQYRAALGIDPSAFMVHYNLGVVLRGAAGIAEAREHFAQAVALRPDFLEARLALCMAELPAIYQSIAEIDARRAAYADRLRELDADVAKASATDMLVDAIGSHQPFYLPYQGRNDRDLQSRYGSIVCRLLDARYETPGLPSPPAAHEPIRLGIVSGFFRQHSNWKIPIRGWLKMLDRDRFRVIGYHTGVERDAETAAAVELCDHFVQGPKPLEAWRRAIRDDAPHVLLFPEIGMDKVSAQLAGMRLAPVQCCSWGHPETSGFPTIDYFISSELMEPEGAEGHYSEKLVRLRNLSIYYEPVDIQPASIDRAVLGLREDAVVYWCAQSLPKYLPQFDEVFARIAADVPGSQFAFIEFAGGKGVTETFKARLARAFTARGLDAADHCVFLPRLAPERFTAAIGLCDLVLDSIGWSGCNSILESLVHNLPIVAFEGELMRGRHAAAILRMMGVVETTAANVDDYLSIACRLGRDEAGRTELSSRIAANKQRVYRDMECIAGLEAFLEQAVRGLS